MLESIPKMVTNKYHKEATPVLRLVRLLWSVFICLVFTRDGEENFRKYCDSTTQPSHRSTEGSYRAQEEIPLLEWKKHGNTR